MIESSVIHRGSTSCCFENGAILRPLRNFDVFRLAFSNGEPPIYSTYRFDYILYYLKFLNN